VDLVRAQNIGFDGTDDPARLARAADDDRVVVTHDINTTPGHARDRLAAGLGMAGVFILSGRTVRRMIDELEMLDGASDHPEWNGRVVFLPPRWPG
jgi:hypothetical protein